MLKEEEENDCTLSSEIPIIGVEDDNGQSEGVDVETRNTKETQSKYSLTESELRRRCNTVEKIPIASLNTTPNVEQVPKSNNNNNNNIKESKENNDNNSNDSGGVFDCNICFDTVHEPVISLCGHLYCWPCIFRWIQRVPQPLCPVCKAGIGEDKLIPVYGRGREPNDPRKNKYFEEEEEERGSEDPSSSQGPRPSAQRPQPDSFNPHYTGPDGFGFGNSGFTGNGISIGFGLFPGLFFSFGGGGGNGPFNRRRSQMTEAERRAADLGKFMLFLSGLIFIISIWFES